MISNQLSMSASVNVIIQVALQAPVMKRELNSKMYSPTSKSLEKLVPDPVTVLLPAAKVTVPLIAVTPLASEMSFIQLTPEVP